ncbi:MAG TPA: cobalt ECF transporter T component CbiQ [Clostridia bacterium]|nr:cobalt ECF transporter T component CbiQ [Clostridia bacterium]
METTLRSFSRALSRALVSEEVARSAGLLQALDPRARLAGMLALVVAVASARRIAIVAALFLIASALALLSRVPMKTLVLRVWVVVLGFTGLIALPALFTTPGNVVMRVAFLSITAQGLQTAGLLVLRVETAVTLTTTLVLCTPWTHILKALRCLRVPTEIIAMLAMTHRYVFLFIEVAQQMFESRQSRILGPLPGVEQRRLAARTAGVLMSKSIDLSNEVFLAMQSRGFRGEVHLLHDFEFRFRDAMAITAFAALAIVAIWLGR